MTLTSLWLIRYYHQHNIVIIHHHQHNFGGLTLPGQGRGFRDIVNSVINDHWSCLTIIPITIRPCITLAVSHHLGKDEGSGTAETGTSSATSDSAWIRARRCLQCREYLTIVEMGIYISCKVWFWYIFIRDLFKRALKSLMSQGLKDERENI